MYTPEYTPPLRRPRTNGSATEFRRQGGVRGGPLQDRISLAFLREGVGSTVWSAAALYLLVA